MRLEPLYRARFTYSGQWAADLSGGDGLEAQVFFVASGSCEGAITGTLTGANFPHRRGDGTFETHFHGVIETDDGASVLFEYGGYGRAYPEGRRQVVSWGKHYSDSDAYRRLNDGVCAITGEVRTGEGGMELVIDVAELIWEPLQD